MIIYKNEFFELQRKSLEALNRLRSESQGVKRIVTESKQISSSIEPYSEDDFKSKLKYDAAYYNVFLKNLEDPTLKEDIVNEIYNLYDTVKSIYKEMDVKPMVFSNKSFIGKTSEVSIEETALQVINNYLDRNYYNLTLEERDRRYKAKAIDTAMYLVTEQHIDIDNAVKVAQKKVIIEGLLDKIAFPGQARGKLDEFINESPDEFFDNTRIKQLYENYEKKLSKVATLLATLA